MPKRNVEDVADELWHRLINGHCLTEFLCHHLFDDVKACSVCNVFIQGEVRPCDVCRPSVNTNSFSSRTHICNFIVNGQDAGPC